MIGVFKKVRPLSCLLAAPLLLLGLSTVALAAPGDYDGDGKSDLSVGLVSKNTSSNTGTTAWLTRNSSGAPSSFWTWQHPADAFVAGRFFLDNQKYYPGIIWVRSSSSPLEWYIKNPSNQEVAVLYGLPGDIIPNLGDFDGDGRDDLTVIRDINGYLHWLIALTSGGVVDYLFGVTGDKPFASDVDGDGKAELVVLRSGYNWYVRKIGENTFTTVQWGLNGDVPLAPQDLDGDHLPDYIIARRTGSMQNGYIRYGNGQTAIVQLGFDSSIPQIGKFGTSLGFAWTQRDTGWNAIRTATGDLDLFKFGIPTNAIIRADGTVVQPSESGVFPAATTPVDPVDPVDPTPGGQCSNVVSIGQIPGGGVLYKPSNLHGGRGPSFLVQNVRQRTHKSVLQIRNVNCELIAKIGLYATDQPYGSRYYMRSGGTGQDAGELRRLANRAGSNNILIEGVNGTWIRVQNPENREGSVSK